VSCSTLGEKLLLVPCLRAVNGRRDLGIGIAHAAFTSESQAPVHRLGQFRGSPCHLRRCPASSASTRGERPRRRSLARAPAEQLRGHRQQLAHDQRTSRANSGGGILRHDLGTPSDSRGDAVTSANPSAPYLALAENFLTSSRGRVEQLHRTLRALDQAATTMLLGGRYAMALGRPTVARRPQQRSS